MRLTLAEYEIYQDAAREKEERQYRFLGSMFASVINCWVKRPITVEKLLGLEQRKNRPSFADATPDQQQEMLAEVQAKLERKSDGEQAASTAQDLRTETEVPDDGVRDPGV